MNPQSHSTASSPYRLNLVDVNEKDRPLVQLASEAEVKTTDSHSHSHSIPLRSSSTCQWSSSSRPFPQSTQSILQSRARPRSQLVKSVLQPWIPFILYASTSLGFVIAISLYRDELFIFLDSLSAWLKADEQFGHAVLFLLIFLTTFPPIPLYSTLIVLSGYTYGAWVGAVISYTAALSGGVVVFVLSRAFLRECISRWLASTITLRRVVQAIERRPKLLFLVRLAPYPYNALSSILSASSTLTLKTYTVCTALSLVKVIIHTSIGASMHSFKHRDTDGPVNEDTGANAMSRVWTVVGVLLCVVVLIYLSIVARRAVDEELDDTTDVEETVGFLSPLDLESAGRPMAQSPLRGSASLPHQHHSSSDLQWT